MIEVMYRQRNRVYMLKIRAVNYGAVPTEDILQAYVQVEDAKKCLIQSLLCLSVWHLHQEKKRL